MKNSFTHTSGLTVTKSMEPFLLDLYQTTGTSLISLIEGLGSSNFGIKSITKCAKDLRQFKLNHLNPSNSKLYIDSSGYSLIKGDIAAFSITKFISYYNHYLENEYTTYDHIFSLDIGGFIKDVASNTIENIYDLNKRSLTGSIKVIKENPIIKEKFIFVLHFKDPKQYQIFDKLYDELEVYNYSNNFSIGGMVSLNTHTNSSLNFAPFIGPSFWAFYQYMTHSQFKYPFKLHFLGVYWKSFRFVAFFLEQLFNSYLVNFNQHCEMTYDSVNYGLTALYKAQVGFPCYNLNLDLEEYDNIFDVPNNIIDKIYRTDISKNIFQENLALAKANKRLTNLNYLLNLNVYSQLQLDRFFEYIIEKHKLIDLLLYSHEYQNYKYFKSNSDFILFNLPAKYKAISNLHIKQIQKSLRYIFAFHDWVVKDQTKTQLDKLISQFITNIDFKYSLSSEETIPEPANLQDIVKNLKPVQTKNKNIL